MSKGNEKNSTRENTKRKFRAQGEISNIETFGELEDEQNSTMDKVVKSYIFYN